MPVCLTENDKAKQLFEQGKVDPARAYSEQCGFETEAMVVV